MPPPLVVPRGEVLVARVTPTEVPAGSVRRMQSGVVQARDFLRAGRAWREEYAIVRARSDGYQEWRSRLNFFRARSQRFWVDVPELPGSGMPVRGAGRENLIRDAAMDTDTDADGVVDGFADQTGTATATLDTTTSPDSQQIDVAAGDGDSWVSQTVLRVFPGDEVTLSAEAKFELDSGSAEGRVVIEWRDEDETALGQVSQAFTNTAFQRVAVTGTAPARTTHARIRLQFNDLGSGDGRVWYRRARFLRASADPAAYANPHVSGASQTGDTLQTAGWPASTTVLKAGDVLRIGGSGATKTDAEANEVVRSFELLEDATSDSGGAATVSIDPPIFSGFIIPDGAALRFENMRLRAVLVGGDLSVPSRGSGLFGGLSAEFVEAL